MKAKGGVPHLTKQRAHRKKKENGQTDKNKQTENIKKNKEVFHIAIQGIHRVRKSFTWK